MRTLVVAGAMALGLSALPLTPAHAGTTWRVGVKASVTQVVAGHKVVFTGKVRPKGAATGEKVVLQERFKPGARWKVQRKAKIDRTGAYRVSDKPTVNTAHSYRVVMPATKSHPRGVSKVVKVKVYAWGSLLQQRSVNNLAMRPGNVNINGKAYPNSQAARWGTVQHVEYNLNHACLKIRATFGLSDDSTTGGQAQVGLLADGASIYTNSFGVGQSESKTLTMDRPLKLRLEAQNTGPDGTIGLGAFGTPTVLCTR